MLLIRQGISLSPSSLAFRLLMRNQNRARLIRSLLSAGLALGAGLLISFGRFATWWLLALAALAWIYSRYLRRDLSTSGSPLLIFHIVAWALLGMAVSSLLPNPTRIIGDVVVLLLAAGVYIRQTTRRIR